MHRSEQFSQPSLPEGFYWFNEPGRYGLGNGLEIFTDEKTDFWQRTHYGFQRDDGHCLLIKQTGDFSLTTRVEFDPRQKYDQCGLIVRIDSQNWIKVSTEYEDEHVSRLGSVATNLGYSDWATQDVPSDRREMWYRISKRGSDFLLENSQRLTYALKECRFLPIIIQGWIYFLSQKCWRVRRSARALPIKQSYIW